MDFVHQVVVGSFLPGHQQEQQKPKKQKFEHATTFTTLPVRSLSDERTEGAYVGPKPNLNSSASFQGDNMVSANAMHTKISAPESLTSAPAAECKDQSSSKCEVSC